MDSSLERNKQLIRRWLEAAGRGFIGKFEEFIAADYVGHLSGRPAMDFDELVRVEREFAAAFPDAHYSVEDLIAERDEVVLRVATRAIHTGEFVGIAPTGRHVQFTGIVIYRILDGKIHESWGELDFAGLWRQLTAPSAP